MTANLPLLPLLTYIDFLFSLNGRHILMTRLGLWDSWLMVIVCVGAATEHVITIIEIVRSIIIVIAIN